jgi:predicted MPP superfamily phosphohydrolase
MDVFARVLAYAGYLWMGFLFLFISASIAIDIYHQFLHVAGFISQRDFTAIIPTTRTALVLSFAWGTITALYGYFEARGIRTERVVINTQKIPRAVGKLTIVQISDVHLGLIVREERLRRITAAICAADPDILVSTGDLVDGQINRMQGLAEVMRDIQPKFGKFAVTGNHEVYAGLNQALEFTERAGFNVLRGNSVVAGGLITVIGVDDPAIERVDRLELTTEKRLLSTVPHDRFTLLLKHRPAVHRDSLGLVDLQLSGHVHKGQIFPFNLVTHLFYPVKTGYSLYPQNFALYVSRGTGTWGPPIRFMAPPEITVIELRHPNQADSNMQVTV